MPSRIPLVNSLAWIGYAAVRLLFGIGLIPVQHATHESRVFSVQEVHAEEEPAKSSKIAGELVLLEHERISPSDVRAPAAHVGVVKIANPVLDGASFHYSDMGGGRTH